MSEQTFTYGHRGAGGRYAHRNRRTDAVHGLLRECGWAILQAIGIAGLGTFAIEIAPHLVH